MWPFRKKTEERAAGGEVVTLQAFWSGSNAASREMAMQIPAVQGCINKISGTVSRLPIKLYRKNGNKIEEVKEDQRVKILNDDTGDTLNANEFWKSIIRDYYLGGGAYAYINRSRGKIKSLHYVDCVSVSPLRNSDPIFKDYDLQVNGASYKPFEFFKLLRHTADGCTGKPLTEECPLIFSVAYNSLVFEDNLVRKGGNKKGFLKAKNRVTDPDKLREAWRNLYSNNSENVMVLNEGMDFQESSSTSVEMQLNENKQTNGTEICKLFGIPPSILLGGATEQDKVNYVDMIVDLLTAIETSLDRDFLLEREKAEMYWAFDTKELTRGSIRERFSAYASALQNNIMQVDEVRELEDLPPTGFHYFRLGLQDVLLDQHTGLIYTPNTNAWAKMNQKALKNPEDSGTMEPRANPYRDEKGRFASAGSLQINIQLFAHDFSNQNDKELSKSIKSLTRQIELHKNKIAHPEDSYSDWNETDRKIKLGRLKHWEHEIKVLSRDLENAKREESSRGKD